jgi:hypothetical protein
MTAFNFFRILTSCKIVIAIYKFILLFKLDMSCYWVVSFPHVSLMELIWNSNHFIGLSDNWTQIGCDPAIFYHLNGNTSKHAKITAKTPSITHVTTNQFLSSSIQKILVLLKELSLIIVLRHFKYMALRNLQMSSDLIIGHNKQDEELFPF